MVPEETARLARAASPKGAISFPWREAFGTIPPDEHVVALSPRKGPPAEAPWRFAVVSVIHVGKGSLIGTQHILVVDVGIGNRWWDWV
jgi:transposase